MAPTPTARESPSARYVPATVGVGDGVGVGGAVGDGVGEVVEKGDGVRGTTVGVGSSDALQPVSVATAANAAATRERWITRRPMHERCPASGLELVRESVG